MVTKSKIEELITAVDDKSLTTESLEGYRDALSVVFARIKLEQADIEKEEALFFDEKNHDLSVPRSDIAIKRLWKVTEKGQRGIDLSNWSKGIEKLLSSIRSRLYGHYTT